MPNMMIELNTERLIIRQATGRDCSELLETLCAESRILASMGTGQGSVIRHPN
jgi:hypothetical protein